jgi:uncharacterized protein
MHQLKPTLFEALAQGNGGPAAIKVLRSAQLSKHLLLIGNLLQRWPGPNGDRDAIVEALDRSRRQQQERFGEILGAPLVGAWAAIVTRAMRRGNAATADFGQLGAVAVVAAAAAGVDAVADIPTRNGNAAVPGLGAARFDMAGGTEGTATLTARDGRLTVQSGRTVVEVSSECGQGNPQWTPLRWLSGEVGQRRCRLRLDDLDPYRHGHHAPPASRLPAAEVDRWRVLFGEAWQLLAEHLPGRADEIASGLQTLVPLIQEDDRSARSATIRDAFGVFGLTRPPCAAEFAVTLVHEFQHSKLSGILDIIPLTDPADPSLYFAPWRVDPRPLAGLLQGVYAFVGVADTWRALRAVDAVAIRAEANFAEARLQVDRGLSSVEMSGGLTQAGRTLAANLRAVTDAMLAEPVPPTVAADAERALDRTRQLWLARNSARDAKNQSAI